MDQDLFENARWLIGSIARGLHSEAHPAAMAVVERLAEQDLSEAAFCIPEPRRVPVVRFLSEGVAECMAQWPDLAAALAATEDHFCWRQSEAYNDQIMGEGFLANYGWCQIVGPHGFFPGRDFLLGLLMLGPGQHYRDHHHPAPELYWPLTASSLWSRNRGVFDEMKPGSVIWHAPHEIHATRTDARPLLTVWCWTRDTATPAQLVDAVNSPAAV